ncbi:MAG: ABC transporter ATP-binding protein [Caldilineaceae bacterium]
MLIKKPNGQQWQALPQTLQWVWLIAWSTNTRLFVGFLVMSLLESVLPAALALTGRGLINAIVVGVQQGNNNNTHLLFWLVLGALLATVNAIITNLGDYWQQCLQDELYQCVGLKIMNQASHLDLAMMESTQTQDLLESARRYGQGLVGQLINRIVLLLNLILRLASLVGILLWIEPLMVGWLAMLALPTLLLRLHLANQTYTTNQRRTVKHRWSNYYIRTLADLRLLPELKLFNLLPLFTERFQALSNEFIREDRQLYRFGLWLNVSFAIVGVVGLYALFGRIAGRIFAGTLTVGDLAIYISSAMQLQNAVQSLVQTLAGMREQLLHLADLQSFLALQPTPHVLQQETATERSFCLSEQAPDLQTSPEQVIITPDMWSTSPCSLKTGSIEFDNVSFTYPNSDEPALANLSFCLQPGETVVIVGENGAGKSTLAMLLAGLYLPTLGRIWVDGVDLQTIDPQAWQEQIGFVFQRFAPYEATVHENIAYGDWQRLLDRPTEVKELARIAQVEGLIASLPQGYETLLGRQFGKRNLSGGQWQKLALARGLARHNARLLILDEPSASLDARAEYELFSRFRKASAGRTTVLISHRFSTIRMADRILVLEKGKLIESGQHEELLARGGHYAMLYRLHRQQMGSVTSER